MSLPVIRLYSAVLTERVRFDKYEMECISFGVSQCRSWSVSVSQLECLSVAVGVSQCRTCFPPDWITWPCN